MTPKTKQVGGLFVKLLIVLLPALVSSYFSYRSARLEAQAHNKITENHSEAGYKVMLAAVEKLSTNVAENAKAHARLQGRVDVIQTSTRNRHSSMSFGEFGDMPDHGAMDAEGGEPPESPGADPLELKRLTIFKKPLPKSLGSAYEMQQQQAVEF